MVLRYHSAAGPPTIRATSSSSLQNVSENSAAWLVMNSPTGSTGLAIAALYDFTLARNSSGAVSVGISKPIPLSPAIRHVSGWVAATHNGGCGFWIGLGTTVTWSSHEKNRPW